MREDGYHCRHKGCNSTGIRVTSVPAFLGTPASWHVTCLYGHAITPKPGLDFVIAPQGVKG